MTFKQLALEVAKREGKKQQISIAQISEVLRCLAEIIGERREEAVYALHEAPKPKKKRGKRK